MAMQCSSWDDVTAVTGQVRRRLTVVTPSHRIDLDDGESLWLHPRLAGVGETVFVLGYGDEIAVWTTGDDPALLLAGRRP